MTVWATKTTRLRGVGPCSCVRPCHGPRRHPPRTRQRHGIGTEGGFTAKSHCPRPEPSTGCEPRVAASRCAQAPGLRRPPSQVSAKRWRRACTRRRWTRPDWAAPPCQVEEDVVGVHVVTCVGLCRPRLIWVAGPGPRRRGSEGPQRCRVTAKRVTSPGRGPAGPRLRPGPSRPSSRTRTSTRKSRNRVGQGCR